MFNDPHSPTLPANADPSVPPQSWLPQRRSGPAGMPVAPTTRGTSGAVGVALASLSGIGYAWLGFQLLLAALLGVARVGADGPTFAIASGSMEPALPVGAIVVTETVPAAELKRNDIISFQDPSNPAQIITHRVVNVSSAGVTTKGDANARADSTAVPAQSVLGKAVLVVPGVAKPMVWIEHGAVVELSLWMASWLAALVFISAERQRIREAISARAADRSRRSTATVTKQATTPQTNRATPTRTTIRRSPTSSAPLATTDEWRSSATKVVSAW